MNIKIIIFGCATIIAMIGAYIYDKKHPPKMAVRLFNPIIGRYYWIPDFPVADEKTVREKIDTQYYHNTGNNQLSLDVSMMKQSIVELYPHAQYWQEGYPYETTIWF